MKDRTASISLARRPGDNVHQVAATEPDEFLRRSRMADALKTPAPATPAGALMAQRVHARRLASAVEQLVIAALPHVDDALTAPMVEVQLHTPGGDGELIASFQLPKEIADTIAVAIRAATAGIFADNAEHACTADTAPVAPVRTLSVVPGGAGR